LGINALGQEDVKAGDKASMEKILECWNIGIMGEKA
jgi:hypothetical protein